MRRAGADRRRDAARLRRMVKPGVTTCNWTHTLKRRFARRRLPHFQRLSWLSYRSALLSTTRSLASRLTVYCLTAIHQDRLWRDLDGYVGDAAITIFVGGVPPESEKLLEATRESLFKALRRWSLSNRLYDALTLFRKMSRIAAIRSCANFGGHGVGQKMHEDPQVPNYVTPGDRAEVERGWVLAVEPMVNAGSHEITVLPDGWTVKTIDGRASSHLEHTIAVTEDGPLVLTAHEDGSLVPSIPGSKAFGPPRRKGAPGA